MRISDWSSDVCSSDLDQLALRVSFKHSEHSGYGRNRFLDTELDDMNKEFVRVKLGIAPDGEAWNLQLSADYSEWKNNGPIPALIAVRPGSVATTLPIAAPVRPAAPHNTSTPHQLSPSLPAHPPPPATPRGGAPPP